MELLRLTLHVSAASVWFGGQIVLLGLLPVLRQLSEEHRKAAARQFGKVAWPAFWLLVATGIWNIVAELDELSHGLLGVKLLAVLCSGLGVWLHQRAKEPRARGIWGAVGFVATFVALVMGLAL